jgi:hypothetical protein
MAEILLKWAKSTITLALSAVLLIANLTPALAQVGTATLSGRVADSSGALLVGAAVQIKNVDTNVVHSAVTDTQGRYRVTELPIGKYEAQASSAKFQTVVRTGITLTVGSSPVVDFALPVGQTTETVTVTTEVSQVETQTSAISSLVTSAQMRDLPLNGRNFSQLISLAPGVQAVPPSPGVAGASFYGAQENYSIAGARPEGQAFLLDNTDLANFWNHAAGSSGTGYSLGVEAIAEFQLLTNTYRAQFGGAGAVVNAATKSGSNEIHGSAYEFHRNSSLDARNYFDLNADGTPAKKPDFHRNQFGFSLGGPVVKDKLFFFGNYEGARQSLGLNSGTNVPMPYVAQGKLPCSLINPKPAGCPASPSGAIGSSTNPIVNVPGVIANSLAIASLFPTPSATSSDLGGYASYTSLAERTTKQDYFLGRLDYTISTHDSLFGRYIYDKGEYTEPFSGAPILGYPSVANSANHFFTLEERHIISPKTLNLTRFTFVRTNERAKSTSVQKASNPLQFYPGRPDGLVSIGGALSIGANQAMPYYIVQNKFTFANDLMWTKGSHSMKMGVQVVRVQTNLDAPFELGGTYNFSTIQDFLQGKPFFLFGVYPGQTDSVRDFREIDIAPYFQDDWKITPKFTLNAGVRYEFATNPVGVRHPLNNIMDPPNGKFVSVPTVFKSNPNKLNFDPRIGFAYDPFKDHKTSIRGGFGVFHNRVAPRTYASGYYFSPPFANYFAIVFAGPVPYPNSFPPPLIPPGSGPIQTFAAVNYNIDRAPYMMQYNASLQREIFSGTILTIGYLGSIGRNLFSQNDVNPSKCNTPGTALGSTPTADPKICSLPTATFADANGAALPRINPANGSMMMVLGNSRSKYNSLQISLNRQMARNVVGQISYTYGKSLDNGSVTSGLEQFSFPKANLYNSDYDWGRSSFDVRHNFVQNAMFSLPFKGNKLIEGWQITEIWNVSTGMPINILQGFDNGLGAAIQASRPNYSRAAGCSPDRKLTGAPSIPAAPGARQWFDPACYSEAPFGTLGNVPRNSLDAPAVFQLDMTVKKNIKLTEKMKTEFRAEFFNILNHPMFNAPGAGIFSGTGVRNPSAGQITSTSRPSRQIQLALKFTF